MLKFPVGTSSYEISAYTIVSSMTAIQCLAMQVYNFMQCNIVAVLINSIGVGVIYLVASLQVCLMIFPVSLLNNLRGVLSQV